MYPVVQMTTKNFIAKINCGTVMLALLLLFTVGTLWDFGLPGLYMDEANHYAFIPGILHEQAATLHHYRFPDNWFDYQDKVYRYPILGGSIYNSTIRTYVSIPFFSIAGYSLETLRIFAALTAFAGVAAAAGLFGRLFGWPSALLASIIITTDPTNALLTRSQGGLFWFIVLFVALAGHALLSAARREKPSPWLAAAAGTCISLATSSYYVGVFFAIPLIAIAAVIYRKRLSHFFVLLGSGLLAFAPIIYSLISIYLKRPDLLDHFGMPSFALKNQIPTFSWANVERLASTLHNAFDTFGFARNIVGQFDTEMGMVRAVAIFAVLVSVLVVYLRRMEGRTQARVLYAGSLASIAIYLVAAFFLKSLTYHHLVPVSILIVLLAASLINQTSKIRLLGMAACAVLLASNVSGLFAAHSQLRHTGGQALHNETVSLPAVMFRTTLAGYHPVFASWGFHLQYLFQTEGKSPYTFMTKVNREKIQRAIARHGPVAVVVWNDQRDAVLKDFTPTQEYKFTQRDGKPLYSILLMPYDQSGNNAGQATDAHSQRLEFSGTRMPDAFKLELDGAQLCSGDAVRAKVAWDILAGRISHLQVFVQPPGEQGRKLWIASPDNKGSQETGPWIQPGMKLLFLAGGSQELLDTIEIDKARCTD